MDSAREGIGLQAYGQRDPLVEYKMSGYEMFDSMTAAIREDTVRILFHIRAEQKVEREPAAKVTGTNRDDSTVQAPRSVRRRRFTRTTVPMRFRQEVQTVLWTEAVREELIDERRQAAVILQQSVQKNSRNYGEIPGSGNFSKYKKELRSICV